jgi:hypothetical protein
LPTMLELGSSMLFTLRHLHVKYFLHDGSCAASFVFLFSGSSPF